MEVKQAGGGGQGGGGVPLTADQVAHQSKSVIFIKFDGVCWSPRVFARREHLGKGCEKSGEIGIGCAPMRVMKQKLIQDNCSLEPQPELSTSAKLWGGKITTIVL